MPSIPIVHLILWSVICAGPDKPETPQRASDRVFVAPDKTCGLSLDLKGFVIDRDELQDNKTVRYVMASSQKKGVNLSFWLFPADRKGDSKVCRQVCWTKEMSNPFKPKNVKMREKGDLAIVNYKITDPIEMKNVRVYLVHKDTWVDIHMSTVLTTDAAAREMERLLDSIKIIDPCPGDSGADSNKGSGVDIESEVRTASRYYQKHDYKQAAAHFQKALDAEKKERTLDEFTWRVMVDSLGMCYGMTGQLKRAKAIFDYGIKEDPKYPMFHYNLACTYAEMGDESHAIASLKKAFEHKKNMIKGEHIPDPRTDASFKKYLDSEAFQAALTEIGA